ncbi:MAG: hypothetical protein ACXVYW_16880 [Oryzihumus sp.]
MCTDTPPLDCQLPSSTEAPAFARDAVAQSLCLVHAGAAELPVLMLVSELVSYAVVYGSPPFSLRVICEVSLLRIEVDAGGLPDDAGKPPDSDESELRDRIIHKVARSWGIDRAEKHATYWCTLPTGAMPRQRNGESTPERMPSG